MGLGPSLSIRQSQQLVLTPQLRQAIQLLQGAVPDAATLPEPQHSQALAAIHFYTALAFNGLGNEAKTIEELEQFFDFNPNAKALDPTRYDATFEPATITEDIHLARAENDEPFRAVVVEYRYVSGDSTSVLAWAAVATGTLVLLTVGFVLWRQAKRLAMRRAGSGG